MTKIAVVFKDKKEAVNVRWQNHKDHMTTRKQLREWNRDIVSFSAWTDCTA